MKKYKDSLAQKTQKDDSKVLLTEKPIKGLVVNTALLPKLCRAMHSQFLI